jgi:hypothetical protein
MMSPQAADRIVRPSELAALLGATSAPLRITQLPKQGSGATSFAWSSMGRRGATAWSNLEPRSAAALGRCGARSALQVPGEVLREIRRGGRGRRFVLFGPKPGACWGAP